MSQQSYHNLAQTNIGGRIPIREGSNYPCTAADLPIESPEGVIGTDAGPVFSRKVAIGKRFYAVFSLSYA